MLNSFFFLFTFKQGIMIVLISQGDSKNEMLYKALLIGSGV